MLAARQCSLAAVISIRGIAFALLAAFRGLRREFAATNAIEWPHQQNNSEQRNRDVNAFLHPSLDFSVQQVRRCRPALVSTWMKSAMRYVYRFRKHAPDEP